MSNSKDNWLHEGDYNEPAKPSRALIIFTVLLIALIVATLLGGAIAWVGYIGVAAGPRP